MLIVESKSNKGEFKFSVELEKEYNLLVDKVSYSTLVVFIIIFFVCQGIILISGVIYLIVRFIKRKISSSEQFVNEPEQLPDSS